MDTEEKVGQTIEELKVENEIAVDLEHHAPRSFQGFTCLIQISTRKKDYIVDVIKLREFIHRFNEVFTDPKILKIFHGANEDITWLQKDFSVYVVNLFDTYQSAKFLMFKAKGLAYLLAKYCDIKAKK